MKEKERYELNDNDCIIDNEKDVAICDICDVGESPKILVDLLNQQNKHIKELEEENKELNDYLETDEVTKREYYQKVDKIDRAKDREIKKLKDKIRELEDFTENTANLIDKLTEDSVFASTQLAISELEKIYNLFEPYENSQKDTILCANNGISFIDYLDNRIKELGGEKNE